ncbi:MAG TPA: cytochrome C oxidase subunit IV family protein [Actinomycetota bacterium]|nr:cytochrome C oxidase subunit IV family protein [Actinomycetota bacterium]
MDTSESVRETARETEPEAIEHEPELGVHPGPAEYVKVAIALSLATAIEVALYYITSIPRPLYIGLLMFFMTLKFTLVVLWFMHLRFDSRLFRRLFVVGLGLALTVYLVVLLTFKVFIRT